MARLSIDALSKAYRRGSPALSDVTLEAGPGEILGILGPSGAGKSTMLRLIAGLDHPDRGTISVDDVRIDPLQPGRRGVAMAFQQPVVYPHLSILDNLTFSARACGRPPAELERDLSAITDSLRIRHLLDRKPAGLSGGERQRVALGRALLKRPKLLLLDEPFANLDAPLRRELARDLVNLQRRWEITTLLVTHDQSEALAICDRLALISEGRLLQVDTPQGLYRGPCDWTVATFLGEPPINRLPVERTEDWDRLTAPGAATEAFLGSLQALSPTGAICPGGWIGLRSEHAEVSGDRAGWPCRVVSARFKGSNWMIACEGPANSSVLLTVDRPRSPGEHILVRPRDWREVFWFAPDGRRLA